MSASQPHFAPASPLRRPQRRVALCLVLALLLGPWLGLVQGAPEPQAAAAAVAAMPCHAAPEAPPAAADADCCDGLCWHCALCGPAPAVPPSLSWGAALAPQPGSFAQRVGRLARGHPDNPYRPPSPLRA